MLGPGLPVLLVRVSEHGVRNDEGDEVGGLTQGLFMQAGDKIQNFLLVLYGSGIALLQAEIDFHPQGGGGVTGASAKRRDAIGHDLFIPLSASRRTFPAHVLSEPEGDCHLTGHGVTI